MRILEQMVFWRIYCIRQKLLVDPEHFVLQLLWLLPSHCPRHDPPSSCIST